ncbi:hypothetical protein JMJ77_0005280, partial [Colletotrichum scovillei]
MGNQVLSATSSVIGRLLQGNLVSLDEDTPPPPRLNYIEAAVGLDNRGLLHVLRISTSVLLRQRLTLTWPHVADYTHAPPVLFISTENPGVTTYRAIQTPSPWGSTSNLSSSRGGWGIGRPPTCHSSGLCLCHLSLGGVDNPQRAVLSKARSSCRIQDAEPGTTLRANSRDNRSGKGLPFLFHAFFFSFS